MIFQWLRVSETTLIIRGGADMPQIIPIQDLKQLNLYRELEISEKQIRDGKVKDARKSLASVRERYGL